MSINNLSNDRGGIGHLTTRPFFLRDDGAPSMIKSLERYQNGPASADASEAGVGGKLFDGGAGKVDYAAIARAMMARLDALRERFFGGESAPTADDSAPAATDDSAADGAGARRSSDSSSYGSRKGWSHYGHWYNTGGPAYTAPLPAAPPPPAPPTSLPPAAPTTGGTTPSSPPPAPSVSPPSTPPLAPSTAPSTGEPTTSPAMSPPSVNQTSSNSISLRDGATTISDTTITGTTGIVGGNATHVTTLNVSNVTIRSTNYGIYLGDCENLNLSNVDIACDPNGGDSYSVRGYIKHLVSQDSRYVSGIKMFRIYGLESGSSTRDTFMGDSMWLGGGPANGWVDTLPFRNFDFKDGSIACGTVEILDETNNVTFDNMDFAGTGHISIQFGAHDITFNNCDSMPLIKFYDASGNRYNPSASELAARNITIA